jgi:uncharacterized membrane protein
MSSTVRNWVVAVGALHLVYMVVEIGFWKPLVPRLKIYDEARAEATAAVGANMGAYNGVIGALLIWVARNTSDLGAGPAQAFATWLLVGVIVLGLFGGLTIKWSIPLFQSLPAVVALYLLHRG